MSIPEYDYQGFVADLTRQAVEMVPGDISQKHKDYVLTLMLNFGNNTVKHLQSAPEIDFQDCLQPQIVIQFVCEWVYHKSIDFLRAKIPEICIESMIDELVVTVRNIAVDCLVRDYELDTTIMIVERAAWAASQSIADVLCEKKYITKKQRDSATIKSYWNDVVKSDNDDIMDSLTVLKFGVLLIALKHVSLVKAIEFVEMYDGDVRRILEGYMRMACLKDRIDSRVIANYLYDFKIEVLKEEHTLAPLNTDKLLDDLEPVLKAYDKIELKIAIEDWLYNKKRVKFKYNIFSRLIKVLKKRFNTGKNF